MRHLRKGSSSFRGVFPVSRVPDRWTASITVNYVSCALGTWATEQAAAEAYDRAVLFYRGPGEKRNFPRRKLEPASAEALRREGRLQPKERKTSRYQGVSLSGKSNISRRWRATILLDGVAHPAGSWITQREAAIAVDRALRFYADVGEHDLNLPEEAPFHPPASVHRLRDEARAAYKEATTSQYDGVHFRAGRYDAYFVMHGRKVHIGPL